MSLMQMMAATTSPLSDVSITLYGGAGGNGNNNGGQGGITTWTGKMKPGTVLTIYVGGQGTNGSGGAVRFSGGG